MSGPIRSGQFMLGHVRSVQVRLANFGKVKLG